MRPLFQVLSPPSPSPGIAAASRRPSAKLPPQQGNLSGVITVVRHDLPEHGMDGRLEGCLSRSQFLNLSRQYFRIGFREAGHPRQQAGKAPSGSLPLLIFTISIGSSSGIGTRIGEVVA